MKAKLRYVFSIAMFLTAFSAIAQNSSWLKLESIDNYVISVKIAHNAEITGKSGPFDPPIK